MIVELQSLVSPRINASLAQIAEFCQRWKITELALFGSILTKEFRPDSDIDVLVTFTANSDWSLFDWVDMKDELKNLLGREIDITDKEKLRNPYRRHEILSNYQVIYASKQP